MDAPKGIPSETIDAIKGFLNTEPAPESQPEENPEAEAEETEAEAQPEVRTFRIKVDGEEIEVPEDEVLKGYSRTADYTRKTQKLSEERKALESEAQAVKAEREQYSRTLEALKGQLQSATEPDWERLSNEDPIEFVKQKELHRDRKDKLQAIEQEQRRVADLQSQEQQRAFVRFVEEEQSKLLDAIPEWKDAKKATAEKEKIAKFALSLGYSEADIAQIYDHRAVTALRKAALYDEMMSKAKSQTEKVKDSPKTSAPGNLMPASRVKEFAKARDNLRERGNIDSFVAAFNALNRKP
jgi:FtsZ-binding cell division protein ZapB